MFLPFAPAAHADPPPSRLVDSAPSVPGMAALKKLIWLYFWLLIFEGALRKWILPGLSNPLLLVRDPVVILIYITAGMAGVFPRNGFVVFTAVLGAVSLITSEIFGTGNLLVTLYGFRSTFLHLPLIFVLPAALDRRDFEKLCGWHLVVAIPMFFLVLAQFRASPEAWVNNGAGGGVGGQLTVGFGKIRPPGTFSFTSGLVSFLAGTAAIAISAQMKTGLVNRRINIAALLAIAATVGISGSRGALGVVILIMVAVAYIAIEKPKLAGSAARTILVIGGILFLLASWSDFQTGLAIHQSRFEDGGGLKTGIIMRVLGDLGEPFTAALDSPFFGHGLGMGTNGGASFLYGAPNFSLGEGDWARTVRESGPILGFLHIGLRIAILCFVARRAYDSLQRDNPLPLLLFAAVATDLLNGQFGVPSLLGLTVFKAGLCLASTNLDTVTAPSPRDEFQQKPVVLPIARGFRGRSAYAEQLHGEIEDPATQRFGP